MREAFMGIADFCDITDDELFSVVGGCSGTTEYAIATKYYFEGGGWVEVTDPGKNHGDSWISGASWDMVQGYDGATIQDIKANAISSSSRTVTIGSC